MDLRHRHCDAAADPGETKKVLQRARRKSSRPRVQASPWPAPPDTQGPAACAAATSTAGSPRPASPARASRKPAATRFPPAHRPATSARSRLTGSSRWPPARPRSRAAAETSAKYQRSAGQSPRPSPAPASNAPPLASRYCPTQSPKDTQAPTPAPHRTARPSRQTGPRPARSACCRRRTRSSSSYRAVTRPRGPRQIRLPRRA